MAASSDSGAPKSGPYTGHVKPGGAPDVRELTDLIVTKVAVDPEMSNNCYVLRCRRTGDQLLIDAAAEPAVLLRLIGPDGLTRVITTHQHWDHHRALADVVADTGAITAAGVDDAEAIREQTGVAVAELLRDGDVVEVGNCRLRVIHLVGHTPGSVALLYDDPEGTPHLWTGDSLFPGGVGNTFGDDAAFATLIEDVSSKIFDQLPDETWFYPGHGDDGVLGEQRPHLQEWRERGW